MTCVTDIEPALWRDYTVIYWISGSMLYVDYLDYIDSKTTCINKMIKVHVCNSMGESVFIISKHFLLLLVTELLQAKNIN